MALTKITLTGTVDTIKAAFTKVNDIIDDLLSTSNGLGASTIGVEDSASNFAGTNVETVLAEHYAATSSATAFAAGFDENSATTTGLTWGYNAGTIRVDNTVTAVSAATIVLTDDATNYVELNQSGTMTKNTTAFTTGYIPVRQIVCASGSQSTSTDKRAWFIAVPDASATQEGVVELATDAETQTGTDTARAVTPANLTARTATATRTGIAELATNAETITGTDTGRVTTPANLTAASAFTGCTATVTLTAAQVKALATPIEMVTAQGANTIIEFCGAVLCLNYSGTGNWAESADDLVFEYETSGVDVSATIDATNFIDTPDTDEIRWVRAIDIQDTDLLASVNKGIMLHNADGNYTDNGGTPTSTLIITVKYRVHNTGLA